MYGKETSSVVYTNSNYHLIFGYVDQLKVWKDYLEFDIELKHTFCNPWRIDNSPKCYLDEFEGKILLHDWGYPEFHREDIISLVVRLERLTFLDAVKFLSDNYADYSKEFNTNVYEKLTKFVFKISFKPRKWNLEDKEYWSRYGIQKHHLELDNVYAVDYFVHNTKSKPKQTFKQKPNDLCYGYVYKDKVKVYRPYAILEHEKWLNNIPNIILGYHAIPYKWSYVIITKSYKDWRVLINLGFIALHVQSENHKFSEEEIDLLHSRYDKLYILFDNDPSGKVNAKKLAALANIKYPDYCLFSFLSEVDSAALYLKSPELLRTEVSNFVKEYKQFNYPRVIDKSWYYYLGSQRSINLFASNELKLNNYVPTNPNDIFRAFSMPTNKVRVIILGQDPYPNPEHANGLAFGTKSENLPASLKIIQKELADNNDCVVPFYSIVDRTLQSWHDQGVMLLNSNLTTRKNKAGKHQKYWYTFMSHTLYNFLNSRSVVILVWGSVASRLINNVRSRLGKDDKNVYYYADHPAAEARNPGKTSFNNCRHFDKVNLLVKPPIKW